MLHLLYAVFLEQSKLEKKRFFQIGSNLQKVFQYSYGEKSACK